MNTYQVWNYFYFFLALFMSGYSVNQRFSSQHIIINWCKTWFTLKDNLERFHLSQLYLLINKAKKKSNEVLYLLSMYLSFPFQKFEAILKQIWSKSETNLMQISNKFNANLKRIWSEFETWSELESSVKQIWSEFETNWKLTSKLRIILKLIC